MPTQESLFAHPNNILNYLRDRGHTNITLKNVEPLRDKSHHLGKEFGFGDPIFVEFESSGTSHAIVIRTMRANQFGHSRRSDRMGSLSDAYDTYNQTPMHIRALDVGTIDAHGHLYPMPPGEPFLVTEFIPGKIYAHDIEECSTHKTASPSHKKRAAILARYLVTLHAQKRDRLQHIRCLRDTLGSGEGIFGISDGYSPEDPVVTPSRLERIEIAVLRWRWRLRHLSHRAARTHGDFHPFNIVFAHNDTPVILDCSRGAEGEPADDVVALSVNYLFFSLQNGEHFTGALRELWTVFWETYLDESKDTEITHLVPPFFAWRILVLACPTWYPKTSSATRERLVQVAENMLTGAHFDPFKIDDLLGPNQVFESSNTSHL